jgi:hypothetical protein
MKWRCPDEEVRFSCETQAGRPTVMYAPVSQPGNLYAWATPEDMGAAWPAERRCAEIARRLETVSSRWLARAANGPRERLQHRLCHHRSRRQLSHRIHRARGARRRSPPAIASSTTWCWPIKGQTTEGVTTFAEGDSLLDEIGNVLGFPDWQLSGARSLARAALISSPFWIAADGGTGYTAQFRWQWWSPLKSR